MNVITNVAWIGGIVLCAAVIAVAVFLVLYQRTQPYEGTHRFADDQHVIDDRPPPMDFPIDEEDEDYR
ncbi:MAG: hypothetical protein ACRDP6_47265 [Actinoallomurus sp.]